MLSGIGKATRIWGDAGTQGKRSMRRGEGATGGRGEAQTLGRGHRSRLVNPGHLRQATLRFTNINIVFPVASSEAPGDGENFGTKFVRAAVLHPPRGSNGRVTRKMYSSEHGTNDAVAGFLLAKLFWGVQRDHPLTRGCRGAVPCFFAFYIRIDGELSRLRSGR